MKIKVSVAPHKKETVTIRTEYIQLQSLLKFKGISETGGQAKEFIRAADATGIVLTKLDGTAKGGSVISIKKNLGVPVRYIGLGEGIDDLMVFDRKRFADTLVKTEGDKEE